MRFLRHRPFFIVIVVSYIFADAPTCHQDRILVVGASRGESLDISCNVDTDPPAHSFKWKFNNSGETMEVGSERFSSNGSTSVLRYTVQSDLDYGTLSCWAENSVGAQLAPCVFQVVAAGKLLAEAVCFIPVSRLFQLYNEKLFLASS